MKKQYFTVAQANRMIPMVEKSVQRIHQIHNRIHMIFKQLQEKGYSVSENYNIDVEFEKREHNSLNEFIDLKMLIEALRDELMNLAKHGCLVKDIEMGIVDWYAKLEDRDIFLCWKLGEKEVSQWHEVDNGFADRQPISVLKQKL